MAAQLLSTHHRQLLLTALPALITVLIILGSTAQAVSGQEGVQWEFDRQAAFRKSDELGISRCSLPGKVAYQQVRLHMWLRMAPPRAVAQPCGKGQPKEACGNTAKVRGFAMLEDPLNSVPLQGGALQMMQSQVLDDFDNQVYLRSETTGRVYNLEVHKPKYRLWTDAFEEGKRSSRANDVIDLTATLVLHPDDRDALVFQIRVEGFIWHCNLYVVPPVLSSAAREAASNGGVMPPAGVSLPRPSKRVKWQHVERASRTQDTETWVMLTNPYNVDIDEYAHMLWLHVVWHQRLGFKRYLLHVWERLGDFISHPRIQELIQRDILVVVIFDDMPRHEKEQMNPIYNDRYQLQVIQYNHAALALWGSDALMLDIDLDEFMLTPKAVTAAQVYEECSDHVATVAALQIHRYNAACRLDLPTSVCNPDGALMYPQWIEADLDDVWSGKAEHPLAITTFQVKDRVSGNHMKAFVDPNTVLSLHVHQAFRSMAAGTLKVAAPMECVRLLHLENLYDLRHSIREDQVMNSTADVRQWWWPAYIKDKSMN